MSFPNPSIAGFSGSSNNTSSTVRTYIDSEGNLVQEGNGSEFSGARLAGGEAFASDSEEDSDPAPSGYYATSSSPKKEKKEKKHKKEKKSKNISPEAVPRSHAAPAGGCCAHCNHGQQPVQQQAQYHQHPMQPMVQGPGYHGFPQQGGQYGGRAYQ